MKEKVMTDTSTEVPASSPSAVLKAIILAAGSGRRLCPFTDHTPKCLATVNGVPILVNALTHLRDSGIQETVIVVGHLKDKVYDAIGDSFSGMKISYVECDRYQTTNNIYSLWLAREHLTENILLLEADVFFEPLLLDRLLSHEGDNIAAVAGYQSWMSGTVASLDKDGNIQALLETNRQPPGLDYSKVFKTLNVYLLRRDFLHEQFVPRLEARINIGDVNQFYEVVFHASTYGQDHDLAALVCDDIKCFEIDDENDRVNAEFLFASPNDRFDVVSREHGSYWRYGFTDHSYLYNLYFPPEGVFAHMRTNLYDLIESYPVAQDALAGLVGLAMSQPAERIVVGNGAAEIIKIISRQLCNHLIIPVPSFNEYANAAPEGNVTSFALNPPFFELNVDEFAAEALRCKADVAVVVSPNNPTSLSVPKADLVRLAEKLASQDCILIVDESFIDFVQEPEQSTLAHELAEHENLAILKSMSKAYGICGLRLGYLLTANHDLAEAVRKEVPIWNINGFAEAFLRLLPRYRREFEASCRKVRSDRDDLYRGLSSIHGMIVYKPTANFVFCRLPHDSMSGPEVTRKLFTEHNIYIKHCAEKPLPKSDRYLRIASRTKPENHNLVDALRSLITGRQK